MRRAAVLVFVLALAGVSASAQFAKKAAAAPASPGVSGAEGERGGPELAGDEANPALRYPAAHQHAMTGCMGYLTITRERMTFESKTEPAHSFDRALADMTTAQQWRLLGTALQEAEFKFRGGGTYHLFHVKKRTVENANTRFGWDDVLDFQALIDGATRFDEVVQSLRAARRPGTPPVISMIEPADATIEGKQLTATGGTLRLRGIASQESGIARVLVNGQPATLRPLTAQSQEFAADVPVGSSPTGIAVLAEAADKSESHKTFIVTARGIRLLEPASSSYETSESRIRVRGVATGFVDVQRVEIAGASATLTRRDSGELEFLWEAPLNVGDNHLQGYVVSATGQREPFALSVKRLAPSGPQPLTVEEVEKALNEGLPQARIAVLVNKYGVDFALTDPAEQRLRRAGAEPSLLLAIAKAKR